MTALFFAWGFLTSLNDILVPHLRGVFALSYAQAALVQFTSSGAFERWLPNVRQATVVERPSRVGVSATAATRA